MTTTPPEAPAAGPTGEPPRDEGPRVTAEEVRDLGRLRRSRTDRKVAGVAGGLARHLDIDPVILRVAFVVLVFFGGAGLILYGACWLLVPEEGAAAAPLHLDDRSRTVALVIAGLVAVAALVGNSFGRFGFPWPLAVVALVAVLFLTRRDARRAGAPAPPPPPDAPAFGTPAGAAWTPPPARPPRRRGPVLFWFTLALIVLAEGALGTVDLAGVHVAGSAYPALALGLTAAMLLLGAFWGRAGGLILLGLVSAVGLGLTSGAEHWSGTTVRAHPGTAAAVHDSYAVDAGEVVLDLTGVSDLDALDGRTVRVRGDVGHLEVIVPDGLAVRAHAEVHGPGDIRLFGGDDGGVDISRTARVPAGTGAPHLTIDADLSVGQIEVHQR
ncbi:PspC domain-containing protein [Nocardioides panaciterrulae]|uniref:Phage shock protein PspC (Stress-responsive transcriptional regulator) n=1 Tax=Nocardioides panaciterrulae TaxID=661492 RepID=A0A7Y9J9N5_9ACTN|nr:PspC domain-containing protein [Nocardioides panaciterrulae]NYD40795.1 phage shock protein PspC (stress-responsive transcriptional regulator) [Nocardioides panaciterrulae]